MPASSDGRNSKENGSRTTKSGSRNGDQDGLRTVPEVAGFLAVSRSKVYAMMDAGELAYVKLGRSRRVRWADVQKLISENIVGVAS